MARLITCGFEMGDVRCEIPHPSGGSQITHLTGTPTIDTGTVRSGSRSLKINLSAAGQQVRFSGLGGIETPQYHRIYLRFEAFPSTGTPLIMARPTGVGVRVTSTGTLEALFNNTSLSAATSALSLNTWYRVEMLQTIRAAATDDIEFRLNGTSWFTSTGVERASANSGNFDFGHNVALGGCIYYIDDFALNDNAAGTGQTSWPGDGKIVLLDPISDNSRAGYTGGAGGTTNLYDAVNNHPPVGTTAAADTNLTQIKSIVSNITDFYAPNLQSYRTGGVGPADTVNLALPFHRIGNATSTTARSMGIQGTSNPAITETTGVQPSSIAIAEPSTTWVSRTSGYAYAPSVTLGTAPVIRTRKNTATTDECAVDAMGMYVDYTPAPAGTPQLLGLKNNASADVFRITTTGPVPAGALVVFMANSLNPQASGLVTFTSVAGGGLTWQNDVDLQLPSTLSSSHHQFFVASAPAPSGMASGTNLDLTRTNSVWGMNMAAFYIEGMDLTSGRKDAAVFGEAETSVVATWSTGAGSTTTANTTLLSGAISDGSDNLSSTTDAPATEVIGSEQHDPGNTWASVSSYRIVTSAGSYTISGAWSTNHDFGMSAGWVAYKAAAGPGPAMLTLTTAACLSNATLLATAGTRVTLQTSPAQSNATLALTAPPRVTLQTSPALSNATLTLTAAAKPPLQTAAAVSSATLDLTVPAAAAEVPLETAAAQSAATLALTAQTRITLGTSPALANATLALTAATRVTLGSSPAVSNATLALTAVARLTLATSPGQSAATLTLTARPVPTLSTSAALSSATLALSAETQVPLGAADAVSTATLDLSILVIYQYARPESDVAATGWTVAPLWDKLDETTPSDADLVTGVGS